MGSTANEIMMFIDTSKCIGCRSCQVACKQWHSLPAETDNGAATANSTTTNESGTATSIDTTTTLTDSAKIWLINKWKNMRVEILTGTGAGQKRTIVSNTATVLTVSEAWTPGLTIGNYIISTSTLTDSTKNWATNEWANMGVEILTGAGQKRTIVSNTATILTVSPAWTPGLTIGNGYAISTIFNGTYTNPPDLSARTLTLVKFNESRGDADSSPATWWTGDDLVPGTTETVAGVQFLFFKDQCRHCYQPKCKRGCPDGVYTTNEGFVLFGANCNDAYCGFRNQVNLNYNKFHADYENGTIKDPRRYIPMTMADHCPYNIPRLSKSGYDILDKSFDRYVKCDFCYDRFAVSGSPLNHSNPNYELLRDKTGLLGPGANPHTTACEYACPTGAIITGTNEQIIGYTGAGDLNPIGNPDSYANRRYKEILPTYPFANIYHGLWGRVHVIWLLIATPDKYGLLTEADVKLGVPGTPSDWAEGDLTWPW